MQTKGNFKEANEKIELLEISLSKHRLNIEELKQKLDNNNQSDDSNTVSNLRNALEKETRKNELLITAN